MPRRAATFLVTWLALLSALFAACAPQPPPPATQPASPASVSEVAVGAQRLDPSRGAAAAADEGEDTPVEDGDPGPLPVTRADPVRGTWNAPVTLVVFSDFECPFCQRLHGTIEALRQRYGADLRVVWKNNPLPFHKNARPAAEMAMAAFAYHGPDAFWTFHDTIFEARNEPLPGLVAEALQRTSITPASMERMLESGAAQQKVEADMTLGKSIGVTGTPASFINGVFLSGAQPIDKFTAIIDEQLAAARALRENGVPAGRVYAAMAKKNFEPIPERKRASAEDQLDTTVHRVPVGDSPVRGKATALVTLVMFSEYECPFCARVKPTVDQLATQYGDDLRIVWKHNPLPFHQRAEPAAQLAIEARVQKGDAAFWQATDLLTASAHNLDDASLETIATTLKLNVAAAKRAIATHKHAAKITADQDLAEDLKASGTPHFFINGRRLVGAQPIEKFKQIIDEELAKANALVAKGTPRAGVYDAIQKAAVGPERPKKVTVPAPGKGSPVKGAAAGKVVVQVFSDFQCPFCSRVTPTIDELVAAFPGKVKVVWRNNPLPFHQHAQLAAEAALEAFAQKGAAGFWQMHDLLFKNQQNLDRAALEQHAASIGLDMTKFRAALDSGAHRAAVEADKKIAEAAGLSGTPAFVINGYVVSGAQPLSAFKKVVSRALAEAK